MSLAKRGPWERANGRNFEVVVYERDYKELCAYVLRKPNIETGGDLFGLWADEYTAVIQLALGPGAGCKRTSVSFYQDVRYLEEVGSYLTQNEGVCHIGEWHSHHQLGLARPSGGDENTVWNNMPTYKLSRFVIFIANIAASRQSYKVNIGCFLFEIDSKGYRLPVLQGVFKILHSENPFLWKKGVNERRNKGEEEKRDDEFNIDIEHLELEERDKSAHVTKKRSVNNKRNHSLEGDKSDQEQPKEKKSRNTAISGEEEKKNAQRVGSSRSADTEETSSSESRNGSNRLLQEAHLPPSNPDDPQPAHGKFVVEMNVLTKEPTSAREGKDEEERKGGEEAENATGRRHTWIAKDVCCIVS